MSWETSKELLGATFGFAVALNAIEAFFDPDGWLWTSIRIFASALFTLALVLWVIAFVRTRRSRSQGQSS